MRSGGVPVGAAPTGALGTFVGARGEHVEFGGCVSQSPDCGRPTRQWPLPNAFDFEIPTGKPRT